MIELNLVGPNNKLGYTRICINCNSNATESSYKDKLHCNKCQTQLKFQCNKCTKILNTYVTMCRHAKYICHDMALRETCPRCKNQFVNKLSLQRHLETCGAEKNYACAHCDFKTKYRKSLICHLKVCPTYKSGTYLP